MIPAPAVRRRGYHSKMDSRASGRDPGFALPGAARSRWLRFAVGAIASTSFALAPSVGLAAGRPPSPMPARRSARAESPAWISDTRALLTRPDLASAHWGIVVYSLDRRRVLLDLNGGQLFTPASNVKLFTTAAALALIGPDYRFRTSVAAVAEPDARGVIHGDLMLIGRGDPNLSDRPLPYTYAFGDKPSVLASDPARAIEALANQIRGRGVTAVQGDIVGDDSYYSRTRFPSGWAAGDLLWGYGAAVSALCVNDNQILLHILPGERAGAPADVEARPWVGMPSLENRVLTVPVGARTRVRFYRPPDSNRLVLLGDIALHSQGEWEAIGVRHPALFAARLLQRALRDRGIAVYGRATVRRAPLNPGWPHPPAGPEPVFPNGSGARPPNPLPPPAAEVELASLQSVPLSEDLQLTDKISQNLHAEMLLRLLGKLRADDGSLAAGRRVRRQFLIGVGISPQEFCLRDGSGLSRSDLASPGAIVRLLVAMQERPDAALWRGFLPIAGVDGSLADRFRNTPAAGRIQAKTGYLDHDYALSGYADTLAGGRLAFSILVNGAVGKHDAAREAVDAIAAGLVTGRVSPPTNPR